MFYGTQIQDTRSYFFTAWRKHQANQPLDQLESQLLAVILQHPEYHTVLAQQEKDYRYDPESGMSNPFLHMGLHLALHDQIMLDRPEGIKAAFEKLLQKHGDPHYVEHLFIEELAKILWKAQSEQRAPDEKAYLAACEQASLECE
ncbi:MAG: DUF1841 family protein [Legionellales bacterium]|nr:DUF1841 family protein [Legionellales bacterium]